MPGGDNCSEGSGLIPRRLLGTPPDINHRHKNTARLSGAVSAQKGLSALRNKVSIGDGTLSSNIAACMRNLSVCVLLDITRDFGFITKYFIKIGCRQPDL